MVGVSLLLVSSDGDLSGTLESSLMVFILFERKLLFDIAVIVRSKRVTRAATSAMVDLGGRRPGRTAPG